MLVMEENKEQEQEKFRTREDFVEHLEISKMRQKKEPKISVVVPAYNVEKFIEETLLSIFRQTVKPYEIIVVDDASSDMTGWIVNKVFDANRKTVPLLKLQTQRKNGGIGKSRQSGVDLAEGNHVAFLSADDVYEDTFLESCMPFLDGETGTFTDYWRWEYLADYKREKDVFASPQITSQEQFRAEVIKWALEKNMFVMFSSVIMPKWWFGKVRFEPALRHGEDLILLLDTVIEGFKWKHVKVPLVKYRIHPQQGTRTQKKEEWCTLWKYNDERLDKLGVDAKTLVKAVKDNYYIEYPTLLSRAYKKFMKRME